MTFVVGKDVVSVIQWSALSEPEPAAGGLVKPGDVVSAIDVDSSEVCLLGLLVLVLCARDSKSDIAAAAFPSERGSKTARHTAFGTSPPLHNSRGVTPSVLATSAAADFSL